MTPENTMAGMDELVRIAGEGGYQPGREPDNADRAAIAAQVLCQFAHASGLDTSGGSAETMLVDLLTNLMHLSDRLETQGVACLLNVAAMHHDDEVRDPG